MKITKAVILAGGLGTRMAPISKVIAKEMLPISNKPVMEYLAKNLEAVGIKDILIVANKQKTEIQNYFQNGKQKFYFVYEEKPLGVVDALLHAESFVNNEPFVLLYGDVLFSPVGLKNMLDLFYSAQKCVLLSKNVPKSQISLYGVLCYKKVGDYNYIYNIIEKPKGITLNSRKVITGQFVLKPNIFPILKNLKEGELFTDALLKLAKKNDLLLKQFKGKFFDIGNKAGYALANIYFSLKEPEVRKEIKKFCDKLSRKKP
ncbi:MAG: NTP transferase domain-containing protein [Clostridia bacterium]|nr:NTP transferase domain-containing protein [Clostridia bacterium]